MYEIYELDFASASEVTRFQWKRAGERRPNLLVECEPAAIDAILHHVLRSSEGPHRWCKLPGTLELPEKRNGTLLLENVTALTDAQQRRLHDWMSAGSGDVQIVSVTTVPLEDSVRKGRFLESLFYRLNVVRVETPPLSRRLAA